MQFIPTTNANLPGEDLARRLGQALVNGKRVLWLVSGGSNIPTTVRVQKQLIEKLAGPLNNLMIMLVDERFGPVGHPDSNWQQLLAAGLEPALAAATPVLSGKPLAATLADYTDKLAANLAAADLVIAQLGLGADSHLAGILPHSNAIQIDQLVASYEAPPFVRLTLSLKALARVQVAYVLAFGQSKRPAVQSLRSEDRPVSEAPSQFLKQVPEAYLYSDQL